jgi:hypothetical protein
VAIWYILWLFGIFLVWYGFCILYQEKSGNPGANPTTSSYNASVVKIYSATNSRARFHNKNNASLA